MHRAGAPFVGASLTLALAGRNHRWLRRTGLASAAANAAFFRHPPRTPPSRPGVVVAPADGLICVVDEAVPPVRKAEPRRTLIVLVSAFSAFLLVCAFLLALDWFNRNGEALFARLRRTAA